MTAGVAVAEYTLDSILDQLNEFHQRATYGAIAGVVNSSPRSLMAGRERDRRSSWIVRRETGLPSGYSEEQKHPSLTERDRILASPDEVRAWLREPV